MIELSHPGRPGGPVSTKYTVNMICPKHGTQQNSHLTALILCCH